MKTQLTIIATAASLLLAAGVIVTVMQSSTATPPQPYTKVINPDIPRKVQLCDKAVDLDRTDMWERFDRELTAMIYTHGNTLLNIKRANKYFPRMAPILKANNIPADMLYLACVESNLDQRAYSGAKAAGIWQFMASTAEQYGLEVNDEIDERYNLEKATAAACRYFKSAYAKYGNWESVMASYNGGMGRISKELEAQGVDTSFDLYLVSETSRYVFRIMALKAIMENPAAFGFNIKADQLYTPVEYDDVTVDTAVDDWPAWARSHGITYAQLVEANPWIRGKKLTNKKLKTYTVKIPRKDSLYRSKQRQKVYNEKWIQNA